MKNIKYYLLIILLLVSFNVKAGYSETVEDSSKINVEVFERTEENNFGIKKHWTNVDLSYVKSTKYVDASKKIYDFSGRLTDLEEDELRLKINEFYNKYKTEIIFVFDSFSYKYDSEHDYIASDFYDFNDFGLETKNYDGILLLVNSYDNPYYDMYTFGDAQNYFNQFRYDDVLDSIYTLIKSKDNCKNGAELFISKVNNYYQMGKISISGYHYDDDTGYIVKNTIRDVSIKVIIKYIVVISSIVGLITILIMRSKNKMVKKAMYANSYLEDGSYKITKNIKALISSHVSHYTVSSSSSSGGGGGSFSGHSGGGFSHGGGRH